MSAIQHFKSMDNIPQKYICPYSKKIMVEPVLVIGSNVICDKKSVDPNSEQSVYRIYDLKQEISDFKNQKVRTTVENSNEPTNKQKQGSKPEQNELFEITLKYQNQETEILDQQSIVKELYSQAEEISEKLANSVQDLKKSREDFAKTSQAFENVGIDEASYELLDKTTHLTTKVANLQNVIDKNAQIATSLLDTKIELEREQCVLLLQSTGLNWTRKKLQNLYTKFGAEIQFKRQPAILNFVTQTEIDENEFSQLFATKELCSATLNLETCKTINIYNSIHIKNLHVTTSQKNDIHLNLEFSLKNINASIILEDCKFDHVGLKVTVSTQNNVFYKSSAANNATTDKGLKICISNTVINSSVHIENFESCKISKSKIQGELSQGIYLYGIKKCELQEVQIQESGQNGILVCNTNCTVKNCGVRKCRCYGIYAYKSKVTGENVVFDDVKEGNYVGANVIMN